MLQWTEPLRVATQLQIPITDAQKTFLDPTRKTLQVFRAKHTFQHAPAFDNVKVLIENRNGVSSWYFWLPVQALLGTASTGAVPAVFVLIFKGEGDFS